MYDIYRNDRDTNGRKVLNAVKKLINLFKIDYESDFKLFALDVCFSRTMRLFVAYNLDRFNLTRLDFFITDLSDLTRFRGPCGVLSDF